MNTSSTLSWSWLYEIFSLGHKSCSKRSSFLGDLPQSIYEKKKKKKNPTEPLRSFHKFVLNKKKHFAKNSPSKSLSSARTVSGFRLVNKNALELSKLTISWTLRR
uniref:Uncharacterized protein n=1 Tax=Cacopsylla melanoneura TaxID=428564 RepID=A0A8D9EBL3_9HEMI